MTLKSLAIAATAFSLSGLPGHAGPCFDEIDLMQSQLEAKIEAIIDTERFAREARRAFGLPPLTRGTLVGAESKLGEGSRIGEALAALVRAREADRTNDKVVCEEALDAARRALDR